MMRRYSISSSHLCVMGTLGGVPIYGVDRLNRFDGPASTLFISQAPSRYTFFDSSGSLVDDSRSRTALCRLLLFNFNSYAKHVDRANLLARCPGCRKSGKGDRWPARAARLAAEELTADGVLDRYDRVLFLGRNVATAFGLRRLEWMRWTLLPELAGMTAFAVLPHPSGCNRWWNDRTNRRAARDFMQALGLEIATSLVAARRDEE